MLFLFYKKWHNNSKKKKGSGELSFYSSKKEVTDAQEQSFNNIRESKATVKIHR